MAFFTNVFMDASGLKVVIAKHPDNAFIALPVSKRGGNDPMPLLQVDDAAHYAVRLNDDGVIIAAATFHENPQQKTLFLQQISTRPGHKRAGHGAVMIHVIFARAAQDGHVLAMTPFEAEGGAAAQRGLPALHARYYPDVMVLYNGQAQPIDGRARYRLEYTPCGLVPTV